MHKFTGETFYNFRNIITFVDFDLLLSNEAEDARMAMTYGMDGIVVSNHGGRQLDGVMAAVSKTGCCWTHP